MNYVSEWFLPKYLIASEKCNQHLGTMTCRLVPFLFQTVLSWKCHDCSLLTCGRIAKICRQLQSLYSEPFSLQKNFKKEAMLISNEKQFQVFSCLYVAFFCKISLDARGVQRNNHEAIFLAVSNSQTSRREQYLRPKQQWL